MTSAAETAKTPPGQSLTGIRKAAILLVLLGDEAASLVGQTLLQLEAVPTGQWTALVQRAAVSLALWRQEYADALSVAGREWDRVRETDDPTQIAIGAATAGGVSWSSNWTFM